MYYLIDSETEVIQALNQDLDSPVLAVTEGTEIVEMGWVPTDLIVGKTKLLVESQRFITED